MTTVPEPLKGAPYIQKLFFGPLDYHIKTHKNCLLAWFLRGAATNQMSVYHTLIEAHNLLWNSSSEKIKMKWNNESEKKYTLRSRDENFLKVPNKPISKCAGFSYYAPNLFNWMPRNIKNTFNSATFKTLIKEWIWSNIPSYQSPIHHHFKLILFLS